MNIELKELLRSAEGRYLTMPEEDRLMAYAVGLSKRLTFMQAVADAEIGLLDGATSEVVRRYPRMMETHGEDVALRVKRDLLLVLRYAVLGMVQHDPDFMLDKLSYWLKTVMAALCDMEQVLFGYAALMRACRERLPADAAEAVLPYLQMHSRVFEQVRRAVA